jgi:hypothetical protein
MALAIVAAVGSPAAAAPLFPTDSLPPLAGKYLDPDVVVYANGVMRRNAVFDGFTATFPPPDLGGTETNSFAGMAVHEVSIDGGVSYFPISAPVQYTVRTVESDIVGLTRVFDTEVLAMDVSGGTLPPNAVIRESPTLPSLGKTFITPDAGGYRIDSFFDVFFELSLDFGQTWAPSIGPGHMVLVPEPATCSLLTLVVASLLARRRPR